ncbi:MAG: hypothetical protein AB1589_36030 [Cyanobacteriota bacterium]
MFDKSLIKNSSPPRLDAAPLQELVIELDEQNEEALSGGIHVNDFNNKDNITLGSIRGTLILTLS